LKFPTPSIGSDIDEFYSDDIPEWVKNFPIDKIMFFILEECLNEIKEIKNEKFY